TLEWSDRARLVFGHAAAAVVQVAQPVATGAVARVARLLEECGGLGEVRGGRAGTGQLARLVVRAPAVATARRRSIDCGCRCWRRRRPGLRTRRCIGTGTLSARRRRRDGFLPRRVGD